MSLRLSKVILQDMVMTVEQVLAFTDGLKFQEFADDARASDAVYHDLIVLGDAASKMPERFVLDHAEIPWQKMVSTRDALVYGYDVIDDRIVWKIIQEILPELLVKLRMLLEK